MTDDDDHEDKDDESQRRSLRELAAQARDRIAGTQRKRQRLQMAGAIGAVSLLLLLMAVTAVLLSGPLPGALFVVGALVGVTVVPMTVLFLRDAIPLSGLWATGLAVVAQVAFEKAALVRRADGRYEWTVLREDADGFFAVLKNGDTVAVDSQPGAWYKFGLGKLAVVEQRGNLEQYRAESVEGSERAGFDIESPTSADGRFVVSLTALARRVRGSASSTLVRRGRDKALDEEGGTGQLSELWTMAFATTLLIVGFGMTFAALSL